MQYVHTALYVPITYRDLWFTLPPYQSVYCQISRHDGSQQGKLKSRKTGMEWKQKVGMRTANTLM